MAGKRAELAGHAQHHRLGVVALELDLALAEIGLDAIQRAQKIVIPEGAAEFAIGDGLQPDVFLPLDDGAISRSSTALSCVGGDLALLPFGAGLFQRRGAQQAADMIGAERRIGAS